MDRFFRSRVLFLFLALCVALTSLANAARVQQPTPVIERFSVLSYDTLNPEARQLSFTSSNPNRSLVETRVDNAADFDQHLYNDNPGSVSLVTDEAYAASRHADFRSLTGGSDINIMVTVYGDLDQLEDFALNTLGVSHIADRIAAPGTTQGMLVVQYLRSWNFGYLLGENTYNRGGRATYPSTFPLRVDGQASRNAEARGPLIIIIRKLIEAALEEPFWNKVHYFSGYTLGCLGVDWDTAFWILYKWEVFEQWLNDFFNVTWIGEDIWGIIWDLIWGMVGYIDGATGWDGIFPD